MSLPFTGDRVAIMAGGRLVAIGSPLHLKNTYGTGYCVTMRLAAADDATVAAVVEGIRTIAADASVSLRDSASLAVVVPFSALQSMPRVLDWIDSVTGDASKGAVCRHLPLVREYGVSGPTLEAVFIAISARAHFALAQEAQSGAAGAGSQLSARGPIRSALTSSPHASDAVAQQVVAMDGSTASSAVDAAAKDRVVSRRDGPHSVAFAGIPARSRTSTDVRMEELPPPPGVAPAATATNRAPWLYQHRALARKNVLLLVRSRGLFFCQLITPLLVLALLLLLQAVIAAQVGRVSITDVPTLLMPLNLNQLVGSATSVPPMHSTDLPFSQPRQLTPHELMSRVAALSKAALESAARHVSVKGVSSTDERAYLATNGSSGTYAMDTDCLEFFLVAVSPDYSPGGGGDGDSPEALQLRVGALDRQYLDPAYNATQAGGAYPRANGSGILGHIRTAWCTLKNGSRVATPYFDPRTLVDGSGRSDALDEELMGDLILLNNVSSARLSEQPPCAPRPAHTSSPSPAPATAAAVVAAGNTAPSATPLPYNPSTEAWLCPAYILPDGTLEVHAAAYPGPGGGGSTPNAFKLALTLRVNDSPLTSYHRPSNFTRVGFPQATGLQAYSSVATTIDPARMALLDMAWRGFAASAGYNMSVLDDFALPAVSGDSGHGLRQPAPQLFATASVVAVGNMPFRQVADLLQIVEVVGAVLHPITLSLQLPLFITVTVLEKEERLTELQRAMGLSMSAHYVVTYALNLALYIAVSGSFWATAAALGFAFFSQTSPLLLGVALLGWGFALVSSAQLIAAFLNSRKTATILGYVIALFATLLAVLVAAGIYGSATPYGLHQPMPLALYTVPVFGLARFLYLGTYACVAQQHCLDDGVTALFGPGEVRSAVWSLYLVAAVYLVLALYFEAVLPRPHGVPRHPLWFLLPDDNAAKVIADEAAVASASEAATQRGKFGLWSQAAGAWLRVLWARARLSLAGFMEPPPTGEEAAVAALLANPTPELLAPLLMRAATTDAATRAIGGGSGRRRRGWALGAWLSGRDRRRRTTRDDSAAEEWTAVARSLSTRSAGGIGILREQYFPPHTTEVDLAATAGTEAASFADGNEINTGIGMPQDASVGNADAQSLAGYSASHTFEGTLRRIPAAAAALRIAIPTHPSLSQHTSMVGGPPSTAALAAGGSESAAPTPRIMAHPPLAAPSAATTPFPVHAVPPLSSRITRHGDSSSFFMGGQRGPTLTDVVAVLTAAGSTEAAAPLHVAPSSPAIIAQRGAGGGGFGRAVPTQQSALALVAQAAPQLMRASSLRHADRERGGSRRATLGASPRRSDDGWRLSWADAFPTAFDQGKDGADDGRGPVSAPTTGSAVPAVDEPHRERFMGRVLIRGDSVSARRMLVRTVNEPPPHAVSPSSPPPAEGSAAGGALGPFAADEGVGPSSLFAYLRRVLVLSKAIASLPLPAAVLAYADGEDIDVLAERGFGQANVWPAVTAQLDDGGGVRSGRTAQAAAATAASRARNARARSRSRGVSAGVSSASGGARSRGNTTDAAAGGSLDVPTAATLQIANDDDDTALSVRPMPDHRDAEGSMGPSVASVAVSAALPGTETIFDRYVRLADRFAQAVCVANVHGARATSCGTHT